MQGATERRRPGRRGRASERKEKAVYALARFSFIMAKPRGVVEPAMVAVSVTEYVGEHSVAGYYEVRPCKHGE